MPTSSLLTWKCAPRSSRMAARTENTMAVVRSAMQLAMKRRLRWLAEGARFPAGTIGVLTSPPFRVASLPVRRRSYRILLQIDDRAGYALALVAGEIKRGESHVPGKQQAAERPGADRFCRPLFAFALFHFQAMLVRGHGPTGIELVDADAVAVQIARRVLGEGHKRAFGRGIRHQLSLSDVGIDGADVDDGPASPFLHASDGLPHAEKSAAHVRGENLIPGSGACVFDVSARA